MIARLEADPMAVVAGLVVFLAFCLSGWSSR